MKKSIFILMAVVLVMTACNVEEQLIDTEQVSIDKRSIDDLTEAEREVIDKLLAIGLSEDMANQIILDVVRPQNTLASTYDPEIPTDDGGIANIGWFKNGMYILMDGPGPGESGGPLADKCAKPGSTCRVKRSSHTIAPIEMDIFFPGGEDELHSIVGPDGVYDVSHPYVEYLTIIFND